MGTRDPRIDAYIDKSADFAQPILAWLRDIVHEACPKVEESIKWSHPHFMYEGMLCYMASFKQHCTFGFWKGALIVDGSARGADAMGQFGRITTCADLPTKKVIVGFVKEAMRLNESGVKVARKPRRPAVAKRVVVPTELRTALAKNRKAAATFEALSPSYRRDYVEWITEAKRDATRQRRLSTTIEWLADGKSRNWKYERART